MTTKVKQYSLEYFAKKCIDGWDPTDQFVQIISEYVRGGNHHPQVAYEGPAVFFAAALYTERFKKGGGSTSGFYPTGSRLAQRMAKLLHITPGTRVLDPGSGFGALSWAIEQVKGVPIMCEFSNMINRIANAAWSDRGDNFVPCEDFLSDFVSPRFDAVIANPP